MVNSGRESLRIGGWWVAVLLPLLGFTQIQAQSSPPCTPSDKSKTSASNPCTSSKPPSVSEQFPYPGEATAPADQFPSSPAQANPASGAAKDRFPYPGEAPADPDEGTASKGGAGESSSSSSADLPPDVDGKPELKDEGTTGSTARGRRRLRPPAQKILLDDERVEEDLSVAHFYQQSGNLNGAYMRTKDALKIQPNAADAHLALAEVAQKMGKRDEAVAEYTKYLELEPDGDGVKTAKKGLEKLKP